MRSSNRFSLVPSALPLLLALFWFVPGAQAAGKVDFARDIRPILSENCFTCHGPDEKARKGGLRLDLRDEAFKPGKSGGQPIVKGAPEKSEIFKRLVTEDSDELMPPAKTKKKLTTAQIDLIKLWIAEGAEYSLHWAFDALRRPEVPQIREGKLVRNPIDAFVGQKLEREGLVFSPDADRATLIRRASLDITGIPPTPREVDAFVKDTSPDAYQKLLDRLFKSSRYGEHMVRYWLDAARYADSHGYHIDSQRDIWPYRDWVIQAYNKNMPFDQFTIEQLAGDLLPGATTDQKVATGYVRCNMSTGEGGAIEAEYQAKYGFDRVETTGAAWLGLTLTCARCHSHKYDPISQKEYYGLFAFFNNLDAPVMDGNQPDPNPVLKLPTPVQLVRMQTITNQIAELRKSLDQPRQALDRQQKEWMRTWHEKLTSQLVPLVPIAALSSPVFTNQAASKLEVIQDGSVRASGPNPPKDVHEMHFKSPGGLLSAVMLEVLVDDPSTGAQGSRSSSGFLLSDVELEWVPSGVDARPKSLKVNRAFASGSSKGFEVEKAFDGKKETGWSVDAASSARKHTALFVLEEPSRFSGEGEIRCRLRFEGTTNQQSMAHYRFAAANSESLAKLLTPRFFDPWQQIGPFRLQTLLQGFNEAYPPETRLDLKAVYPGIRDQNKWSRRDYSDGAYHELVHEIHGIHGVYYLHRVIQRDAPAKAELTFKAGEAWKIWLNDRLVAWSTNRNPVAAHRQTVKLGAGENRILVKVVSEASSSGFNFRLNVSDPTILPGDVAGALLTSPSPAAQHDARARSVFRAEHLSSYRKTELNLDLLREQELALSREVPTTLIAKELPQPRETRLLARGEYDKPGEKVEPHVPSIFPPLPPDSSSNRLALAKWLVDPKHPLTPRVAINRLWQQVFGQGLVKTSEDFGVQGERPSHPELLDWLASEYISSGWDTKHMLHLMLNSTTYRQTSKASQALRARDPENRLLARGPRFRVDGEVLRDMALSIGGILVEKTGGRSSKPYEPGGLWEAVSFNNIQRYVMDDGDGQYRRSVYTNWKRQSPPPNMLVFDAPTREYCVVKRPRTNTPLQALVLLNDPQFVEAANAFAVRILEQGGQGADSRIQFGFKAATGRSPDARETALIRDILKKQLEAFKKDPAAAGKLLSVGNYRSNSSWNQAELAAWSTIASMLLNLDETVTKG